MRLNWILFLLMTMCISGYSQKDPYAKQSIEFIKSINHKTTVNDLEIYFDDSLKTDSLRKSLSQFRNEILKYSNEVDYHTVKIDRPYKLYVITLYNAESKEFFGELRLIYRDEMDFLIDDWIYLKDSDVLKHKIETDRILQEAIPLPPHPPK